jgi:hypothetical protein
MTQALLRTAAIGAISTTYTFQVTLYYVRVGSSKGGGGVGVRYRITALTVSVTQ